MTYKTKNQVINPRWIIRSKILKTGINDMVDRFMPIRVIMTVAKCCAFTKGFSGILSQNLAPLLGQL